MHEAGFDGPREVAFVFSGQGSQWRGMGRELLRTSDAFRAALTECDAAVREELGWSVVDLLLDDGAEFADAVERVQPALWAVEVALAAHWRGMGVEPDLVIGHSMGEAVAACVAGACPCGRGTGDLPPQQPDAAPRGPRRDARHGAVPRRGARTRRGVRRRRVRGGGELAQRHRAGRRRRRTGQDRRRVGAARRPVPQGQGQCRLPLPLMDEIRDDLLARLADVEPAPSPTGVASAVRCACVRGSDLDAAYWVDNLRRPVRTSPKPCGSSPKPGT